MVLTAFPPVGLVAGPTPAVSSVILHRLLAVPEIRTVPSPLRAAILVGRAFEDIAPHLIAHGRRTARLAARLARAVGMSRDERLTVYCAARLHDVGCVTLPLAVLQKDGPLTGDEYALVQSHPRAAIELLGPIPALRAAAVLIAHHHERWDGAGYPYGVAGPWIPLGARILAVADTFDAILTGEPGSVPTDRGSALGRLKTQAGHHLDPALVTAFLTVMGGVAVRAREQPALEVADDTGEGLCRPLHGRGLTPVPPGLARPAGAPGKLANPLGEGSS